MSDYCKSCGCRQPDPQRGNLHHYTNCPDAPGGAILHLRRIDQRDRDKKDDEIERLRGIIKDGIDVIDQEGNAFAWMEAACRALEADDE
jgi:hypothetical protein